MSDFLAQDWEDILDDIRDQKAVLLIGPEIMKIDGQAVNQRLRKHLLEHNRDDIAYYYERDGFFLFRSPEGKVRTARQVKRFYRNVVPDEALLQRIVEIPFHLIVSLNPDSFLSETFYRHGIKHRFHHFQHRNRDNENDEIEKPVRTLPLIYNLFGSKEQDDSMILDYDDVFKFLQSAFGPLSLPNKLLRSFREASTYIFLGFQFEKWYSQLLLKFFSENGRKEKLISIDNAVFDEDTHQFIVREFQIRFPGDQFDFFNQLYIRCRDARMLRALSLDGASSEATLIRQRVANGELIEALELLHQTLEGSSDVGQVILLKSRHSTLQDEQDKGKLDSRDYRTELSRIIDGILELTKTIGR